MRRILAVTLVVGLIMPEQARNENNSKDPSSPGSGSEASPARGGGRR